MTKNAEEMLCALYSEYLQRRKSGMPTDDAARFEDGWLNSIKPMSGWLDAEIRRAQFELKENGYLKEFITGDCCIPDEVISGLKNKFGNDW